jgi:hypothetical protein
MARTISSVTRSWYRSGGIFDVLSSRPILQAQLVGAATQVEQFRALPERRGLCFLNPVGVFLYALSV